MGRDLQFRSPQYTLVRTSCSLSQFTVCLDLNPHLKSDEESVLRWGLAAGIRDRVYRD